MKKPSKSQIAAAKREIAVEDDAARQLREAPDQLAIAAENSRRSRLPSEHPDHICGLSCDGQDGSNSYCARLRRKLFDKPPQRRAAPSRLVTYGDEPRGWQVPADDTIEYAFYYFTKKYGGEHCAVQGDAIVKQDTADAIRQLERAGKLPGSFQGFAVRWELLKEPLTVAEAGRKGGTRTSALYGSEHYQQIGKKGGARVRELVRAGKAAKTARPRGRTSSR